MKKTPVKITKTIKSAVKKTTKAVKKTAVKKATAKRTPAKRSK